MRLEDTFKQKPKGLLNIFCTAGFPGLNDLPVIMDALEEAGVDMMEIGIPYSDPLADGPVIQNSSTVALNNGMDLDELFGQLSGRKSTIPIILMGYLNQVLQFGWKRFCKACVDVGVETLILPDMPVELYHEHYRSILDPYGISMVFLVTPETTLERVRLVNACSHPFIYAVSSNSTTGNTKGVSDEQLDRLAALPTEKPVLIGFNIASPETLNRVQSEANGGIIGSAFIKALTDQSDVAAASKTFIRYIKGIKE